MIFSGKSRIISLVFKSLFLFMVFLGPSVQAQSLDSLVAQFNRDFALFMSISPFGDSINIDSAGLRPDEIAEIRSYQKVKYDYLEPIEVQAFYASRLDSLISTIFNDPAVFSSSAVMKIDANVLRSQDSRILQISYPENTGGTYRSNAVYYLYEGKDQRYISIYDGGSETLGLDSDGYHSLDYLGKRNDTSYYLVTGGVRGCSYCFSSSIGVLWANGYEVAVKENINVNSRDWAETINLQVQESGDTLIQVLYEVDDLSGECYCDRYLGEESEGDREEAVYCKYLYRFKDFGFQLLEQTCIYDDPFSKYRSED